MKIVAIDLAVNNTGISFLIDGKVVSDELYLITCDAHKNLNSPRIIRIKGSDGLEKFKQMKDAILQVLSKIDERYGIDLVVIEDFAFGAKGKSILDIGQNQGIVRMALYEAGYKIETISPTLIKKTLTGSGNSPKSLVALKVFKRTKLDLLSEFGRGAEDVYDSIAVGITFFKRKG